MGYRYDIVCRSKLLRKKTDCGINLYVASFCLETDQKSIIFRVRIDTKENNNKHLRLWHVVRYVQGRGGKEAHMFSVLISLFYIFGVITIRDSCN